MDPTIDPATGQPLPADAIQRILYIGPQVHVYNIPPLPSTKGHTAAHWTDNNNERLIFTARIRVLETAWEEENAQSPNDTPSEASRTSPDRLKVDVILEDPSNGQLFAAAPYTTLATVEPVVDSSRFFALRVQDPSGGRKATLGIGFEDRSEAFDFSVALQEAMKSLGMDGSSAPPGQKVPGTDAPLGNGASNAGAGAGFDSLAGLGPGDAAAEKRDYSLKEGETITVNLGGKFGRRRPQQQQQQQEEEDTTSEGSLSSFSLPPPPPGAGAGGSSFLPPPPPSGASHARTRSRDQKRLSAQDLGFDDGKFGEFA